MPEQKSTIRLSPFLLAVDAGHAIWATIPMYDIDGESRVDAAGGAPDIGHDELLQLPGP